MYFLWLVMKAYFTKKWESMWYWGLIQAIMVSLEYTFDHITFWKHKAQLKSPGSDSNQPKIAVVLLGEVIHTQAIYIHWLVDVLEVTYS